MSALEVERLLLEHARVAEVAVVGVSDERFGQTIGAVVVRADADADAPGGDDAAFVRELLAFGGERMARYKLPRAVRVVGAIPKNAMGKVNKKELAAVFDSSGGPAAGEKRGRRVAVYG